MGLSTKCPFEVHNRTNIPIFIFRTTNSHCNVIGCKEKKIGEISNFKYTKNGLPPLVWNRSVPDTELEKLKNIIEATYGKKFNSYWELHKWSIDNFQSYWCEVWKYLDVIVSSPYEEVYRKTGDGFLDCEWFPGARFNYAENLLRIRDDRVALICVDQAGNEETVTFAELYEEVRLYAAAFKKNGLKKDDRVAFYMSNRKEAVFSVLAAISIGAISGGPNPLFGCMQAMNVIKIMEPKFLISIDHHADADIEFHNIDHLEQIANNIPSLEKIIIVVNKAETLSRDLSHIRNSCLLKDFLDTGRNADGTVPILEFDQLSFDHPIAMNFTSGTTGLPKAPVHSNGCFVTLLSTLNLCWNLKPSDVIFSSCAIGWSLWEFVLVSLARGAKLLLFAGSPFYQTSERNVWDLFTRYNVTSTLFATSAVDYLIQQNIVPGPDAHLKNFKFVGMCGSPVRVQYFMFLRNKVKKDVFICNEYGTSEVFGVFNGVDQNLPVYAGEVQVPSLGMDIQCYDEDGNVLINKRGEMVLATPTPTLPVYLWGDKDNRIMQETYLNTYPGAWCQHDEICINPKTKGIIVIGRSDDAIIQYDEMFAASEIYQSIFDVEGIEDAVCVSQRNNLDETRAVLFIKMKEGHLFTQELKNQVEEKISLDLYYEYIPQVILETKEIPRNFNDKKVESIVRKIIASNKVPEVNNIKNPECLKDYIDIPEIVSFNRTHNGFKRL